LSFDKTPFLPKISKKGMGRKKGTKLIPKPTFKPIKKAKKKKEIDQKCQKNQ
jgi:hypothetical protein